MNSLLMFLSFCQEYIIFSFSLITRALKIIRKNIKIHKIKLLSFCFLAYTAYFLFRPCGSRTAGESLFVWITSILFTLRAEQSSFKFVPDKFSQQLKKQPKKPPQQLRPVKVTGFPFSQYRYHAAPGRSCAPCSCDISASMHVNLQKTLRHAGTESPW